MNPFRFLFPDTTKVKPGTLWLANKSLVEGKYSTFDLIKVGDIYRGGLVRSEVIPIKAEHQGLPDHIYIPRHAIYPTKYEIATERHIITEEHAKQLGFQI